MTGILGQLKWESLKKRRKDNRLILLYKGLKGKAKIPTDDLIPKTRHGRNQHSLAFQIPSASKDVYVTGEKMLNTFCPGRGSNQDLLRGSQTLYRVAIKAGLYRKAVQVCIIPNITTYSPSILDSSPNLN